MKIEIDGLERGRQRDVVIGNDASVRFFERPARERVPVVVAQLAPLLLDLALEHAFAVEGVKDLGHAEAARHRRRRG